MCLVYLDAKGLLGQPAAGYASVIFWREGVGDAQLLAHILKGIIVNQPKVFQKFFSAVNSHEHPPLISLVLKTIKRVGDE